MNKLVWFLAGVMAGVLWVAALLLRFPLVADFVARGEPYCESATLGGQEVRKCWRAVEVPAEEGTK